MHLAMSKATMQTSLYLLNALSVHLSLSPPNPPAKQDVCTGTPGTDTLFERLVQHVTFLSKASVWFFTCLNIIGTFSHGTPFPFFMSHLPRSVSNMTHPVLFLGTILTVLSAILRFWCFKSLGHLFTFEITIRPKHELITHGPYAYVRHPSYTGVYLTLIGATFVLIAPGNWTADSGIRNPLGLFLFCLWMLKCTFVFRGMGIRLRAEDSLLRANFGSEWEVYAKRVPYKFIPGVY